MITIIPFICLLGTLECQIASNNPFLNKDRIREIARHINDASYKYNISPKLYSAILMQESSYKINAVNCHKRGCDYGISQINQVTAKKYKFDKKRLTKDLKYSIMMGAKILSWFQKTYSKKEPDTWFCRYNIGTGKITNKCLQYKENVLRWIK